MGSVLFDIGSRIVLAGVPGSSKCAFRSFNVEPRNVNYVSSNNANSPSFPPFYEVNDSSLTDEQRRVVLSSLLEDPVSSKVAEIYSRDTGYLSWGQQLPQVISNILVESLLLAPKNLKAIVIESIFMSLQDKFIIEKSLFMKLGFRSITWLPEPIMESIAANTNDSIVVHLGWSTSVVTIISDLRIINSREINKFTGCILHYKIIETLVSLMSSIKGLESLLSKTSCFNLVENFIQNACYVGGSEFQGDEFELIPGVSIPNRIRHEVLEELITTSNVVPSILSEISNSSIDLRSTLIENIVFAGGLSNIPGLKSKILEGIRLSSLYPNPSALLSLGSWAGASIYYSSLHKDDLKKLSSKRGQTKDSFLASYTKHF
ncbi:hypothetical protein CAAN1_12S03400 [[Candida] anglica]|uniref:Uncharacterized protein n=1 Tax=[Candida] anglica TaxID=148631 RepID=A0ABP0E6U6_9ASCO